MIQSKAKQEKKKGHFQRSILESEGFFGPFGGAFVPEVIRANLDEVDTAFRDLWPTAEFQAELQQIFSELCGRPTPLTPLRNISALLGGAQIYAKNEGLNHTGAHKINHCIGQALLARHMGRKRIIAETGAGQHGMATATVCARFQIPCTIYMGYKDYLRQRPNVCWMEMLGAEVIPVKEGGQTLNSAVIAAMKDLMSNPQDTHYLIGTVVGPHPYPKINTLFQKIIGEETKSQFKALQGGLPDAVIACAGGGSNAMGIFHAFLDAAKVQLMAVEAGGHGTTTGQHAARMRHKKKGIFEGYYSYFLQDEEGNIAPTASISAGLDYCGISPLLAWLSDEGRVDFAAASDQATIEAYQLMLRKEGLIPALESTHAFAHAFQLAQEMNPNQHIVVNMSGRGEKDLFIVMDELQPEALKHFMQLKLNQQNG